MEKNKFLTHRQNITMPTITILIHNGCVIDVTNLPKDYDYLIQDATHLPPDDPTEDA